MIEYVLAVVFLALIGGAIWFGRKMWRGGRATAERDVMENVLDDQYLSQRAKDAVARDPDKRRKLRDQNTR